MESFPLFPILALVTVAAFFSASETALFSLSRFQLKQIKARSPKLLAKIQFLLDRPAAFVATILIGNEVSNVLISHLLAEFYQKTFKDNLALVTLINLVTTIPFIFIVGEITPKILASRANVAITPFIVPLLSLFHQLLFPLRFFIELVVDTLTLPLRVNTSEDKRQLREEDFLHIVEDIKNKGAIEKSEKDLIENVFDMDDDNSLELSTPLNEVFTVKADETVGNVIEKLKRGFAPRIPVLSHPDRVIGILYAKDLLKYLEREEREINVKELMKEPLIVDPFLKGEALFKRFRQMRVHIAVVENKDGRAVGIVTMDDILEQMFGELWEAQTTR